MDSFIAAYATLRFAVCDDGALEDDVEKIALFARSEGGVLKPTHAARQLPSGKWTSKLGALEGISHEHPDDLRGRAYGTVACYLARRHPTSP